MRSGRIRGLLCAKSFYFRILGINSVFRYRSIPRGHQIHIQILRSGAIWDNPGRVELPKDFFDKLDLLIPSQFHIFKVYFFPVSHRYFFHTFNPTQEYLHTVSVFSPINRHNVIGTGSWLSVERISSESRM